MTIEITEQTIEAVVATIVERFHPERVLLFGSRARGDHRPDSDLDLFIEMDVEPSVPPRERARRIRAAFAPYPCPMDIVVYTPAEAAYWRNAAASLPSTVAREGKLVYERAG